MGGTVEANLAMMRRAYEIWNAQGPEGLEVLLAQFWAPEILFYEAAEFPDTGVFHGADAVADHLRGVIEAGGPLPLKVHSLEGRGAYVLAELEITMEGASSGAVATTRLFHLARLKGGDRVVELRSYLDGARAREEYERLSAQSG